MKKYLDIFGLVWGLAAVVTLTFFLISSWGRCVIPFEPNPFIRIPEIIIGITTILIMIKIIYKKCVEK